MSTLGRKFKQCNAAAERIEQLARRIKRMREQCGNGPPPPEAQAAIREFREWYALYDRFKPDAERFAVLQQARAQHKPVDGGGGMSSTSVNEPDLYTADGPHSFFSDLYRAQLKNEPEAHERISRHQAYEVEKRAVTSATLGGILPAAYLVELYAKASRGGRVFANEINNARLPDVGMSVVVPRLTQGLLAAAQTTRTPPSSRRTRPRPI